MPFTDDTDAALRVAVALVNSAEPPDSLTSRTQLEALLAPYGYTGRRDRDDAELQAVRGGRAKLRELLVGERDALVPTVNAILSEQRALPQLVRHDEQDWHIHAVDPQAPLPTRILVETAMAMIDVIRADELGRLAICADGECSGLVLDLSRNRSRRYCSTTCSNRNAQAAHRARQRSARR